MHKQYKDQGDQFTDIKRLEEEYEAKTAEFKKTIQYGIQLIYKQSSEKEETVLKTCDRTG